MDDRLRQLERAARANPDDVAAGRALVRALDQAGDAVGAWQARCRLARAGDDVTLAELRRLPAGALSAGQPIERTYEGELRLHADARTVLVDGARLEALDAATLEPRWSVEGGQDVAALAGPFVAHAPRGERTLVLRDARDGAEVARVGVPGGAATAVTTLDGLIVAFEQDLRGGVAVVDLGERPGTLLAVRHDVPPFGATRHAARGLRLVRVHASIADAFEARDVDTDATVWETRHEVLHASEHGVVVETRVRLRRIAELDPVSGALRWSAPVDGPRAPLNVLVTPELVVVCAQVPPFAGAASGLTVAAHEREDGARRWTRGDDLPASLLLAQTVADGLVAFVRAPVGGPGAEARLEVLDALTGETRWSHPLDRRVELTATLCAVDHGLVVAWPDGDVSRVLRVGAP